MNALEFLETLVQQDIINRYNSNTAYEAFKELESENAGSYPYFRTKFNNKCKELGIRPAQPTILPISNIPIIAQNFIPESLIEEAIEYATRETHNYKTGDKLPEVPGLIPTGTLFDEIISDRVTSAKDKQKYFDRTGEEFPEDMIEIGGFTRQCVDIIAGDPGAGKTYSRNMLAAKAKVFALREQNKKLIVHFISGEMRASEWAKELNSCELLKEVEVTYMLDYVGQPNYEDIFWDAFAYGDVVICDSLPAIISHFKMSVPVGRKVLPETQMIFDFIRKSLKSVEDNDNNVQLINQANKDGNYKGGTELPHMMSSMSFVKLDGQQRYMIFEKNRNNGKVRRKVFFSRIENGDIVFNTEVYRATYEQVTDKKQSLNEFIDQLKNSEVSLQEMHDGDETTLSPAEMGTGGETEEELAELNQAEYIDNGEDDEENMAFVQVDLLDSIAEIEAENA